MSFTIRHPAPTGGTWYAYPIANGNFVNWLGDRIQLTDPDNVGLYSGEATTPGPYGIFEGSDAPTNWDTDMVATWEHSAAPNVSITPAMAAFADRVRLPHLILFTGETGSQSITVTQADQVTPLSLDGMTLELSFSDEDENTIATISNGSLEVSGESNNVLTFSRPAAVTNANRRGFWAVRSTGDGDSVVATGTYIVEFRPKGE